MSLKRIDTSVSKEGFAKVTNRGKKEGTATITVSTKYNSKDKKSKGYS
jgi:hypothetical protein